MCNIKIQTDGPRKAARQGKKRQTRQNQEPDRLPKKCLFGKVKGRLAVPGLVSVMLVYVMVKTAVLAGLSGMHKTGCFGQKSLVLHVSNSSCAGKRFDHCGSDYSCTAKTY